jgi:release factor glutamine methyltransferase
MSKPSVESVRWSIGRVVSWTTEYLARSAVAEPRLCAEILLAHACGERRIDLYTKFDQVLEPAALDRFRDWVRRAAAQEPIAYLVGEREFFSLPFVVTPAVLIPRPETETMVEVVIDHCFRGALNEPRILEIGTGSACIAVAIAKNVAGAHVVATDISIAALDVARQNVARHGLSDQVTLVQADRCAIPAETLPAGGFNLLVSNPPYVAEPAMNLLDRTVRDYEPTTALTDGADGLSFYRDIARNAEKLLASTGRVVVEIGDGLAEAVLKAVAEVGGLRHERTIRDRVVRKDRVLVFQLGN